MLGTAADTADMLIDICSCEFCGQVSDVKRVELMRIVDEKFLVRDKGKEREERRKMGRHCLYMLVSLPSADICEPIICE